MFEETEKRKVEHIKICLNEDVQFRKSNGFERFEFIHNALPDINFDEIDMRIKFLGKEFEYPVFIEAMVGGTEMAKDINRNLALAAQKLGIGMGVGSQRAMLENDKLLSTYYVRDIAPDIFLVGNIGAIQLLNYDIERIIDMVKEIEADALAIHLNAAQEIVQPEGDRNWKGVYERIKELCKRANFPIIAKEVGNGINGEIAKKLVNAGVKAIDIAGAGGTSWVKVEYYRKGVNAEPFFEWGIPTADALRSCTASVKIPIIASGGIYNGLDAAKAIAMGATLVGIARPLLNPAIKGWEEVVAFLKNYINEMKIAMFLVNAKNLNELKKRKIKAKNQ